MGGSIEEDGRDLCEEEEEEGPAQRDSVVEATAGQIVARAPCDPGEPNGIPDGF